MENADLFEVLRRLAGNPPKLYRVITPKEARLVRDLRPGQVVYVDTPAQIIEAPWFRPLGNIIAIQQHFNCVLNTHLDAMTPFVKRRRIWWKPWTWFRRSPAFR